MKINLNLVIAAALCAFSGMASAQSAAVNPFSRPAPPPPPPVVAPTPEEVAPEPEPVKEEPPVLLEEISASRIGVVNGKFFYRGDGTYLFDEPDGRELIRRVKSSSSAEASEPSNQAPAPRVRPRTTTNSTSAASTQAPRPTTSAPPKPLPSMIGKPAAKN